ncbi:MAG: hypothetical protein M1827_001952 [Pycnora praestabilis]|nr:MAG: hypothetical protein M1827_001952 [Pycnora praestabilis]
MIGAQVIIVPNFIYQVNEASPDIVYNSDTQLWACCNTPEYGLNCANPSNETFYAPDPEQLYATTTTTHVSSMTSTSSASSTSTGPPSSSLLSTTASSNTIASSSTTASSSVASSGLTTGAKAGIGVGVAIGALALLVGVLYFIRRSRRYKAVAGAESRESHPLELDQGNPTKVELDAREFAQLPDLGAGRAQELH